MIKTIVRVLWIIWGIACWTFTIVQGRADVKMFEHKLHGTEVQWVYNACGGHTFGLCLMVGLVLFVAALIHAKYHDLDVAEGNAPLARFAVPGTYEIDEWSEWEE